MNLNEYYLTCLSEECNEVGQRVSKALRFGLDEVQKGQTLNNSERISEELRDLISIAFILEEMGLIKDYNPLPDHIKKKKEKIIKYMKISVDMGVLKE